MLMGEIRAWWTVEGPRVAGSHLNGDWFPLIRCSSEQEARDYVQGLALKNRAAGRTSGWRILRVETKTDYLETYMDVGAVLGPLPDEGDKGS